MTASAQSVLCTSSLFSSTAHPLEALTDMFHSYLKFEAQNKHFGTLRDLYFEFDTFHR
jgi:hypothetical protein